ncbi:hypothetical protein L1049_018107 [Liquidambar formosana]|uniref:Uncharacterized protein n=1 Tax=Liquidambar formosana TaxID=63359 RepID=A0AAP0R878_LIQFO
MAALPSAELGCPYSAKETQTARPTSTGVAGVGKNRTSQRKTGLQEMSAPEIESEINETRIVPPTGSESDLPPPGAERNRNPARTEIFPQHPSIHDHAKRLEEHSKEAKSRVNQEFQCDYTSFEVGVALGCSRDSRKSKALAKSAWKIKKLLGEILGWKKKCLRSKKTVRKKSKKPFKGPIDDHSSPLDSASISDGGIVNRNHLILQEAKDTWSVLQRAGFRSLANDHEILEKISELEDRDWELFENH